MSAAAVRMVIMHPFPTRSAPPERALPAGRIGYDLDADVLRLHTIQTVQAFEQLQQTGALRADPARVCTEWPEAYGWMSRMMQERLPTTGDTALWLWARIRRDDLVRMCRRERGQVLLECRVPRARVLLSHFDEWHSALNVWPAVPRIPGEPDADYDRRYDQVVDDFRARLDAAGADRGQISSWSADLRADVEQSWECMFDRSWYGRFDCWQATVHELLASDVVEAVLIE